MAELILALDTPDPSSARKVLDQVGPIRWVKLGSVLFTEAGPSFVAELKGRGHQVFLDLKWHDIPNTVAGAVKSARRLGVDLVTVHTLGGKSMMAAAKDAAGDGLKVVGVTVLTSHDECEVSNILGWETEPAVEVVRLADLARAAGIDGVVSSPAEVARLRALLGPKALLVAPGIRPAGARPDDQSRTATASAAASAGASYLVVGRPVLDAPDPRMVWQELEGETR